ncbi:MAG: hypothetical protein M3411_06200, partial [Chloroflexota bacterium]|nr:hypothetical protein [Chloroflexota bacterium]
YSLSDTAYRVYAFPAFRYSDIIWLYLRDNLATHPIPYVDYSLEYPPLTGILSYLFSFAPNLPTYFSLTYLVLAFSAIGTVAALQRLPATNPWYFAATPTIFFYTGYQWDMAAVFVAALALLAFDRNHDRWGAFALAAAVSMKLFPLAILPAILLVRVRQGRIGSALAIGGIFTLVTAAINLPFALTNFEGWSFFYRWNRDRLADSGIWILWRDVSTEQLTQLSLIAAVVGGVVITGVALRTRTLLFLPLSGTYLLWWIFINKTFTTHLVLWVFLALALLRPPWWLWIATVAIDIVGFQLGNYLNLYNVTDYQSAPLIEKAVSYLYDPLQLTRSIVLLTAVGWGIATLLRPERLRSRFVAPSEPEATLTASNGHRDPLPTILVNSSDRPSTVNGRRRDHLTRRLTASIGAVPHLIKPLGWGLVVTALYAATTVLMTWPYALHLRDSTLVGFDPLLQIWLAQWIQHALVTDPLHLYDANIFHPFAQTLAYTDANIPGALLAAPIDVFTQNAILTNSLLVLASFVFAGLGMYALVVSLTGNRAAGFLAGLAFAYLPFRYVHLWHVNWLQQAWMPWLLLAFVRLLRQPTRGRALVLGGLIAIQTLTSFYFAVQIAILLGFALLCAMVFQHRHRSWRLAAALAVTTAVAAILTVPLYLPYLQVRSEQGLERSVEEAELYKAQPESYRRVAPFDRPNPLWSWLGVRPGPNVALTTVGQEVHADGHQHQEVVLEDALFPGTLALVGAAIGLLFWRRQRWLALALALTALTAAILSLGPTTGPPESGGRTLPYGYLFEHVPLFTAMRVAARLGGLTGFAVVVLAGLGAAATWTLLRHRLARSDRPRFAIAGALTCVVAGLILFELYAAPIPLEQIDQRPEVTAPYTWLAAQPDDGAVMEFPAESIFVDRGGTSSIRRHTGLAMFWSTTHWKPLVNGNSGFIPPAYNDLIDAFRGILPRPDGSITDRISHVGPEHVVMLQQMNVRYLLFHRSQYTPEDWAAVIDRLTDVEGEIDKAGDFGEATIYTVRQPLAPIETAELNLYAPTLGTAGARWAPTFMISQSDARPSFLAMTRKPTLTTIWHDEEGRELWRGTLPLPLPAIVGAPQIQCSVRRCQASTIHNLAEDLPPPTIDSGWRPTATRHYVARLIVTGDQPIDCTVDIDIVADAETVKERSPANPARWARCTTESKYPVNNPGGAPFRAPSPSVTFIDGQLALESSLTSKRDEEIRGWFLLAPPGAGKPWLHTLYQSNARQRLLRAGEPAEFEWLEPIAADVPPGVYDLSIWFHRRTEEGWEHAIGGGFELSPVVVDGDGTLRWAGPLRLSLSERLPRFQPGAMSALPLETSNTSRDTTCEMTWRLLDPTDRSVIEAGASPTCDRPTIWLPPTLAPGRYDLEVTAYAVTDHARRVSDGRTIPINVVAERIAGPS